MRGVGAEFKIYPGARRDQQLEQLMIYRSSYRVENYRSIRPQTPMQ